MKEDYDSLSSDRQIIEVDTLEEFTERLKRLDWYYHMSDDPRVYREGDAQREYYQSLVSKGKEWQDAWDRQKAIVFSPERGF